MDVDDRVPRTDARRIFRVLWRRKWWVFLTVDVLVVLGILLALREEDLYSTTALVQLPESTASVFSLGSGDAEDVERELATQQRLVTSPEVSDRVEELLGDRAGLIGAVSVSSVADTLLLAIDVESSDPTVAQDGANAYAAAYAEVQEDLSVSQVLDRRDQLVEQADAQQEQAAALETEIDAARQALAPLRNELDDLEAQALTLDGLTAEEQARRNELSPIVEGAEDDLSRLQAQRDRLEEVALDLESQAFQFEAEANFRRANAAQVVATADLPAEPAAASPVRDAVTFGLLGLVLGIGLAFGREYLDDSIHDTDDLGVDVEQLPVIGTIANSAAGWSPRRNRARELVAVGLEEPLVAESYRALRTNIEFAGLDRPNQVLLVTSAGAGEGKSTTLANLAAVMAAAGSRVVVMCCDLRRPQIHEFFGLTNEVGLTSVLLGTHRLDDALQTVELPGGYRLQVLPSGPLPPNPSEVLGSARTGEIVDGLRARADYVMLDPPPVVPVTDAVVTSRWADAIVAVARTGVTSRRGFAEMVRILERTGIPLLGIVLNGTSTERRARRAGYLYQAERDEGMGWSRIVNQPVPPHVRVPAPVPGPRDTMPFQGGSQGPAAHGAPPQVAKDPQRRGPAPPPAPPGPARPPGAPSPRARSGEERR